MTRLRTGDLLRMAARASLLQATWNYERQQGLGWAWSLRPALDRLHLDRSVLGARLAEHTAYFNTQPTLCSLALGAVAGLEEQRAVGAGPDAGSLARIKAVMGSSLAALGDRMFWFTLRPLVACLGLVLAVNGSAYGALVMWLVYNAIHQGIRFAGVGWGYRLGPAVLSGELRARLEKMLRWWALLGAAAIGVIVAVLLAPGGEPAPVGFQIILGSGLSFGLLAAQRVRPSPTEWALGAGALSLALTWHR